VRQVLLKGTDPSVDGQEELDAMADDPGWNNAIAAFNCKETALASPQNPA
jgi:hypothetical protein